MVYWSTDYELADLKSTDWPAAQKQTAVCTIDYLLDFTTKEILESSAGEHLIRYVR